MIFIELKNDRDERSLLELYMEKTALELVFWLYPESLLKCIFNSNIRICDFEISRPVTTYNEETEQKCSSRIILNKDVINYIENEKKTLKENVDSICLYNVSKSDWIISLIGHEGMALVKDDENINSLLGNGFKASLTPPDWW